MPSSAWRRLASRSESAGEVVDGAGCCDGGELVGAVDERVALGAVELLRGSGDGVDVVGGDGTVVECFGQLRCCLEGGGAFGGLGGVSSDCFEASAIRFSGNESTLTQLGDEAGVLGVAPCLDLADRHQARLDLIAVGGGVATDGGDVFHPLDDRCDVHVDDHTEGRSRRPRAMSEMAACGEFTHRSQRIRGSIRAGTGGSPTPSRSESGRYVRRMDRIEIEIKLNRDRAWLLERLGSMPADELTAPRTFSEHDPDSRWSFADHFVHTTLIEQNWNAMFRRHVVRRAGSRAATAR